MPLPPTEERITLGTAARKYPGSRGADRLHPATVVRWITHGVKSLGGTLVKLEAERVGYRWLTSAEALERFAAALAAEDADPATPPRTPTQRQRAADRAGRELEKMGA